MKKNKSKNHLLELVVFVTGAIIMIFELVGSRMLAPYFGTSIFVWTSIIGVILGSLSAGYYLGGKYADKKPKIRVLNYIILSAALFIFISNIIKDFFLSFIISISSEIKVTSVFAAVILFTPTSLLLGMVSPYAVRLKLRKVKNTGSTVGTLYALSTIGSIFGTFLAGFYLIPFFGTSKLLIILSFILVIISIPLLGKRRIGINIVFLIFIVMFYFQIDRLLKFRKGFFVDKDTQYNRVFIYHTNDKKTDQEIRVLRTGRNFQSAMILESDKMHESYLNYFHLANHFYPDFNKTLMFGGAGYSFPKDFLKRYPNSSIDVIEIDPMITDLAKQYFNLKSDPRLQIFHKDARMFLNQSTNKYDVIFIDAFSSGDSVPYQLTTLETVKKEREILSDDGLVLINIISSLKGENSKFLWAQHKTYNSVFPFVYVFQVNKEIDPYDKQNIIILALKSDRFLSFESKDKEIKGFLENRWTKMINGNIPILTDDHAPVDYYLKH